jgi:uncharacterized protein YkwD
MLARRRRSPLAVFAATLVASFAFAAPAAVASGCPGADMLPAASSIAAARGATLCLLNEQRRPLGLAPLVSQPQLEAAATSFSRAMVDQRFFDHVSPSGQTLAQRLGPYLEPAQAWAIGENIAWGQGPTATPASIVDRWMHSEPHRVNILASTFREIGIGIVNGSPRGDAPASSATYTTEFGLRDMPPPPQEHGPTPEIGVTWSAPPERATGPRARAAAPPKAAKRVSAAAKRRINAHCRRSVRRTRSSRARKARFDRCVRARLRAARS